MAYIDILLDKISDEALRQELRNEVDVLLQNNQFGLVFQRHQPESARSSKYPLKKGSLVQLRSDADGAVWYIRSLSKGIAKIAQAESGEELDSVKTQDLIAVIDFGKTLYPGLKYIDSSMKDDSKPHHIAINGENYHALEVLNYTMAGTVDVIYIDPPYNSGATDWTYNNDYVDRVDQYRHSKWLAFMERRLKSARNLLKPDSVMVVTIDEHEVTRLGVLLGQVFKDADITLVSIVNNPKGVTRPGARRFSRVEEYAYFCFFGNAELSSWQDDLLSQDPLITDDEQEEESIRRPRWKGLLRSGTNARRADRHRMFYPVLIDESRHAVVGVGPIVPLEETPDFDAAIDGLTAVWPIRSDLSLGNWGVGSTTLKELIDQGYVSLGGYDARRKTWALSYLSEDLRRQINDGLLTIHSYDENKNVVDVVYAPEDSPGRRVKTVWKRSSHDAGIGGTELITSLIGPGSFSFPKSVFAVRDTIGMLVRDNPNARIVDFFAGSGTTFHAVAMLNSEDGGKRQSILVTNNEVGPEQQAGLRKRGIHPGHDEWEARGIFRRATKPRMESVVSGISAVTGSPIPAKFKNADKTPMSGGHDENLAFFELTYHDPDYVSLGKSTEELLPLLWIMAGAHGRLTEDRYGDSWQISESGHYAILWKQEQWRQFIEAISDVPALCRAFIQTASTSVFQQIVSELPTHIQATQIFDNYLSYFASRKGSVQ